MCDKSTKQLFAGFLLCHRASGCVCPQNFFRYLVRFYNHAVRHRGGDRFVKFTLEQSTPRVLALPVTGLDAFRYGHFLPQLSPHSSHTRRCDSHTDPAVLALPPLPTVAQMADVGEFLTYRKPVCHWPRGGLSLHHCLCKNHNCSCCPGTHGPHWPAAWHFSCGYQLHFSAWKLRLLQL